MKTHRTITIQTLTTLAYILRCVLVYTHIDSVSIIQSLSGIALMIITTWLYTLILRPYHEHVAGIIVGLTILHILGLWATESLSRIIVTGIVCVHVAVYIVYIYTMESIKERIVLHLRSIANAGLVTITWIIAIGYACLILGTNRIDDVTCTSLRTNSTYLISQAPHDVSMWISSIYTTSVGSLLGVQSPLEIGKKPSDTDVGFIQQVNIYAHDFVQSLMYDKSQLDQKICDYTLGYIQRIYHSKPFIITSVIFLTILLSLFIRIMMIIIGCINWFLLLLMIHLGYIQRRSEMMMVERLG